MRDAIKDGCQRHPLCRFGIGKEMRHISAMSILQRPKDHPVARRHVFVERAKADARSVTKRFDIGFGKAVFCESALQPRIDLLLDIRHS